MGTDAACLHELVPVEEGETSEPTLGEIATEFVMEPADLTRIDTECDEGGGGEEEDEDEDEDDEHVQ